LKDWSSGNPPSNAQVKSFNASSHVGVYKAHQATLNRIFNGSMKKYHALMARLYKAVRYVLLAPFFVIGHLANSTPVQSRTRRPLPHRALVTISISTQWPKNNQAMNMAPSQLLLSLLIFSFLFASFDSDISF
jgi:hypothetical protein